MIHHLFMAFSEVICFTVVFGVVSAVAPHLITDRKADEKRCYDQGSDYCSPEKSSFLSLSLGNKFYIFIHRRENYGVEFGLTVKFTVYVRCLCYKWYLLLPHKTDAYPSAISCAVKSSISSDGSSNLLVVRE